MIQSRCDLLQPSWMCNWTIVRMPQMSHMARPEQEALGIGSRGSNLFETTLLRDARRSNRCTTYSSPIIADSSLGAMTEVGVSTMSISSSSSSSLLISRQPLSAAHMAAKASIRSESNSVRVTRQKGDDIKLPAVVLGVLRHAIDVSLVALLPFGYGLCKSRLNERAMVGRMLSQALGKRVRLDRGRPTGARCPTRRPGWCASWLLYATVARRRSHRSAHASCTPRARNDRERTSHQLPPGRVFRSRRRGAYLQRLRVSRDSPYQR